MFTSTAAALVFALVNGCVAGTPLVCAVWMILRFSRRQINASTRYWIWWIALAAVALLPLAFLPSAPPRASVPNILVAARPALTITAANLPPKPAQSGPAPIPLRTLPWWPIEVPAGSWCARVIGFWALVSIAMALRLAISYGILARRKKQAPCSAEEWQAFVTMSLARLGSGRRVRVAAAGTAAPVVAGPVHAAILLPPALLAAMDRAEIEQLCLHEAAHVARYDDWMLLVQRVVEAAFALHPLVRWISSRIHLEREIACDDVVVSLTGEARHYAACLTHTAELARGFSPGPAAAAATSESSNLTTRVEMLLDRTRLASTRLILRRFGILALGVLLVAFASARMPRLFALEAVQQTSAARAIAPSSPKKPEARPKQDNVLVAQASPQTAPQPRVSTPALPQSLLQVSVTDSGGRFVTGLDSAAFQIFENGVQRKIESFSSNNQLASLSVVWGAQRVIGQQLMQTLFATMAAAPAFAPLDVSTLAANGNQVRVEDLQTGVARLRNSRSERKALLVVYDATGTAALPSEDEIRNGLIGGLADAQVFAIGVAEAGAAAIPSLNQTATILADATGGRAYSAVSPEKIFGALDRVAVELLNQYVIGYTPVGNGNLDVRLVPPAGLPPLTTRFHAAITR